MTPEQRKAWREEWNTFLPSDRVEALEYVGKLKAQAQALDDYLTAQEGEIERANRLVNEWADVAKDRLESGLRAIDGIQSRLKLTQEWIEEQELTGKHYLLVDWEEWEEGRKEILKSTKASEGKEAS